MPIEMPKICREIATIDMDTDEDQMEQQILQMDLFYSVKPEIESPSLSKQTDFLTNIAKSIVTKKLKKIQIKDSDVWDD